MILAVDTSLGTAVALIGVDGSALAQAHSSDGLGHAEVIGGLLQQVLTEASGSGGDVTHVVAGMGPGPFTGLRIGIAAARTFALGRGVPVVAVPSHWAVALGEIEQNPDAAARPFAVVTDARRREAAVTVVHGLDEHGLPRVVVPPGLVPRAEVSARLSGIRAVEATELSAVSLARVGQRAVAAGRVLADAEPLYLRAPDAKLPAAPKRVGV